MSIHDDSLNNFITEITGGHWAWIGGVRTGQGPRDFSWEDGSKWEYTNWKSGQPDNFGYCATLASVKSTRSDPEGKSRVRSKSLIDTVAQTKYNKHAY